MQVHLVSMARGRWYWQRLFGHVQTPWLSYDFPHVGWRHDPHARVPEELQQETLAAAVPHQRADRSVPAAPLSATQLDVTVAESYDLP